MTIKGTKISMIRGDSGSITVRCRELPFTEGDTITMTVRESVDSPVELQKVVTEFDPDGQAAIAILPEDTSAMAFGDYVYDIQLTRSDGAVTTLVTVSRFTLEEEVTYD